MNNSDQTKLKISWPRRVVFYLYRSLIKPKSANEDSRRREFILNIILFSINILLIILEFSVLYNQLNRGSDYQGVPLPVFTGIVIVFIGLLALSRTGKFTLSSYIFLSLLFGSITYTAYYWGVDLPSVLLGYALLIVISSILIGTRIALIATVIIGSSMFIIGSKQIALGTLATSHWKNEVMQLGDVIEYTTILFIIMVVSWLSNRELEKSLDRARRSEAALKEERDMLEIKVEERTRAVRQSQMEQVAQLEKFAEFGRLASGLFHDLINPLTAISFSINKLKQSPEKLSDAEESLNRAFAASKRMEDFIRIVRKQLQPQNVKELFLLNDEIEEVLSILNYKAKKAKVDLIFDSEQQITLTNNPFKFHQIVLNLVSNAIDAYENLTRLTNRQVIIKLASEADQIRLQVIDYGVGIKPTELEKIFEPFYTTKNYAGGIGLGLSSTKEMIQQTFRGQITVESRPDVGSTFTVTIPKDNFENNTQPK